MNITESFDQFSSRMSGMDLALYAGVGLVLWVLFKDKLSPVQKLLTDLFNKFNVSNSKLPVVEVPKITPVTTPSPQTDDTFFKLVVSWKQTRDLAEKSNCVEAIKVADQMFPFLSPNVCKKEEKV
jgi:hypothetical protein